MDAAAGGAQIVAAAARAIQTISKRLPEIVLDLFSQLVLFVAFVCVYVNALDVLIANVAIPPGKSPAVMAVQHKNDSFGHGGFS